MECDCNSIFYLNPKIVKISKKLEFSEESSTPFFLFFLFQFISAAYMLYSFPMHLQSCLYYKRDLSFHEEDQFPRKNEKAFLAIKERCPLLFNFSSAWKGEKVGKLNNALCCYRRRKKVPVLWIGSIYKSGWCNHRLHNNCVN